MFKALIGFVFTICIALIAGWLWINIEISNYMVSTLPIKENIDFEVKSGANFKRVHTQLIAKGIMPQTKLTFLLLKLEPQLAHLKAGTYQAKVGMTVKELYQDVLDNKEYSLSITLVEGKRFQDWLAQIQRAKGLVIETKNLSESEIAQKIGATASKLEGLLLPETYRYSPGSSDLQLIARTYKEMDKLVREAWTQRQPNLPLNSPYEMLTLASIIEKETGLPQERGMVSSVFINRLNKKMLLQTDPTVIYGMGDNYKGRIRKVDLTTATPYNTYVIQGLPPTPIAMPSKESIMAAVNPMKTNYYYFVATGDGGHQFSTTLAEHNKAVQAYLKMLRKIKEASNTSTTEK